MTESELSGAGMAPNSPTHPLAPLSAKHTVGPHTLKGMESCFSSLFCSPREPAPAPEHPPLPGQLSCVFPSHFRPCFVLSLVEAGWRLLLQGAPPSGHWEGGQDEAPPELALLSQGPSSSDRKVWGFKPRTPTPGCVTMDTSPHLSEPLFLYNAAAADAGKPPRVAGMQVKCGAHSWHFTDAPGTAVSHFV